MHLNDVVQLLADYSGTLTCRKQADGSVYVEVHFPAGDRIDADVDSAGFDIESVMNAAKRRIDRIIRFRGVVPIGRMPRRDTTKQGGI